jgi:phosphatidylglycerophosphate synthase
VTAEREAMRDAVVTAVAGLVAATVAACAVGGHYGVAAGAVVLAALLGQLPGMLAAVAVVRRRPRTTTPADRVTLARAALAGCMAATAVLGVTDAVTPRTWWVFSVALVTLLLDGVDGWVARRTSTVTPAGALLDMQVDAGYLVVLSLAAAPIIGWWVLLIGALRYLFVAASWLRPQLTTPLPRSRFRVAVAAAQGAALVVVLAPVVPVAVGTAGAAVALALLFVSFASQIAVIERTRG